MNPLVSVITPSFNQGRYLEETILSVLNQTYENIEFIIIDGGSSDNSVDVINKYASKLAYWVSEPDKGQADAINKGFLKAQGEFVCWINSDDFFYPDFISERVRKFQEYPHIDMIYGDVDQGTGSINLWCRRGGNTSANLMRKTLEIPIPQQSALWRKSVLNSTGFLDPQLHVLLDRDFFIRIARNHKILYIPGTLAFFRIHEKSKSINEALKWSHELPAYYKFLIDKWDDYKKHEHIIMAKCYWYCSNICLENNEIESVIKFRENSKEENKIIYLYLRLIQRLVQIKHQIKF
jgi:glycosyltransferase involved in cell wall biosynthesis